MPLYALADHLKLKRIAVVCHAVGGHVRIKYALQKPGNPSQLALVCTGARFLGGDEERGGFSTEFWARLRESMKKRRERGLATPKQVRILDRMGFKRADEYTFDKARKIMDLTKTVGFAGWKVKMEASRKGLLL